MEITSAHYKLIEKSPPIQRGNVKISNLPVLNTILYVAEQGCKWRGLSKKFGNWHSIYMCANRWAKQGVYMNWQAGSVFWWSGHGWGWGQFLYRGHRAGCYPDTGGFPTSRSESPHVTRDFLVSLGNALIRYIY